MLYVTELQAASACLQATVAQLQPASNAAPVLVMNRGTRLEIQSLSNAKLPCVSLPLNGRLSQVLPIRPHGQAFDWLMLITADLEMAVVEWNEVAGWRTLCRSDLRDKAVRPVERMLTAVESRLVLLQTAHGQLKVIPIKGGAVREAFNVRIEQLRVLSLAILNETTPADHRPGKAEIYHFVSPGSLAACAPESVPLSQSAYKEDCHGGH